MPRLTQTRATLLGVAAVASACAGHRDVTSMHHYWGGYEPGDVWELIEETVLTTHGHLYSLSPHVHPQPLHPGLDDIPKRLKLPRTIDDYRHDPSAYPSVEGTVPAGTRFQIDRFVYSTIGPSSSVKVMAHFENFQSRFTEIDVARLGGGSFRDPKPDATVMTRISAGEATPPTPTSKRPAL